MSYILEALKKAEQERDFGRVPGIGSPHDQPLPRPQQRWPWVLAAALLLTALLVAGVWWGGFGTGDGTTPTTRPARPVAEGAPAGGVMPSTVASRLDPVPRVGTATSPAETDSAGAFAALPTPPPPVIARRPLRPLPLPDPLPTSPPAQAEEFPARALVPAAAQIAPPDFVTLRAPSLPPREEPAGKGLPLWPLIPDKMFRQVKGQLVLNVHVYSANPDERFVVLNMKKYREGVQISEGPNLEEITREGVILRLPDGRFFVKSP
jgi:general secretion pathway protein B